MEENKELQEQQVKRGPGRPPKNEVEQENKTEIKNEPQKELEKKPEEKFKEEVKKELKKQDRRVSRKQIDSHELIPCRCVRHGGVTYRSPRSGLKVKWSKYGDEEFLEFGEILTLRNAYPKVLEAPWILIDDEEAVEYLGLKELYEDMANVEDVEKIFKGSFSQIKNKIKSIPVGVKSSVAVKCRELIQEGKLYDLRVIKFLEEELGIDLQIFIE